MVESTLLSAPRSRLHRFVSSDWALPLVLLVVFVAGILLSGPLGPTLQPVFVIGLMVITLGVPVIIKLKTGGELAFFLLVPTVISASQNIYLLAVTTSLTSGQVRFLIIVNFVYAVALLVALEIAGQRALSSLPALRRLTRLVELLLLSLLVFAGVSAVIFGSDMIAAIASLRNLITPLLFTLIGLYASRHVNIEKYFKYFLVLGVLVMVFGVVEMVMPSFWQTLGLDDLWVKKGLHVNAWGTPTNFRASEFIGNFRFNRMAGPFADPVHLGTFLFAVLVVAWYLKKRVLAVLAVIAVVFSISKGALLGILVFAVIWPRYFASRVIHIVIIALAVLGAAGFYYYSLVSSSGSTTAHINGLLSALADLVHHPLGRGLGNAGVLANRLSDSSVKNAAESGLGVIIAQLGFVGIAIFAALFALLLWGAIRIKATRTRCLALVMLVAFALNAAFNEVALSPNSAAPYFIILGLLIGRDLATADETPPLAEPKPRSKTPVATT